MYSRKRGSNSFISRDADSAASRLTRFEINNRTRGNKAYPKFDDGNLRPDNLPPTDRPPQDHVASLGSTRTHPGDGTVGGGGGRADSFRVKSHDFLAAFDVAVKRKRGEYVARLVEYHERLCRAAESVTDGDELMSFIDDAMFVAHRIAGVAKTLGFPELGNAARKTEAAIVAYRQELGSTELRRISYSRIRDLARMIEAICAEHGERLA